MQWVLLGSSKGGYDRHWVTRFVPAARHRFIDVHPPYEHDRSRPATGAREWVDVFRHALRGLRIARLVGDPRMGFVTLFPQLAVALGLLKRLLRRGGPVIAWSFNLGRAYTGWKAGMARAALAGVERIVVHSRQEIRTYAAAFGLPESRFVFVPFSVNALAPTVAEETAQPFLLAMGTANRDYACLFEAVRGLDMPLVVVAGPHAFQNLSPPPNVELRSGLSLAECHLLAQRARLSVVPILNTFSASGQVTVIEAMMFARCVVATRSIGTEDYVTDEVDGVLVPPADPAALRAALLALWEDAPRRARIGAAARQEALENLTHEAASRTMLRLCDEAAATVG